jgi:REP element-mobilizing transposase RayT
VNGATVCTAFVPLLALVELNNLSISSSMARATRRRNGGLSGATAAKAPVQLPLPLRTWGGRRSGAGRKPNGPKAGVSHLRRPTLKARHPVHVTMRLCGGLPSLRHKPLAGLVLSSFHAAKERLGARLVHFSVQSNHVHLLVEVDEHRALSRAMQGLATRLAKRLNHRLGRRGAVFADRYHSRALATPLEVRRALVYVQAHRRTRTPERLRSAIYGPLFRRVRTRYCAATFNRPARRSTRGATEDVAPANRLAPPRSARRA